MRTNVVGALPRSARPYAQQGGIMKRTGYDLLTEDGMTHVEVGYERVLYDQDVAGGYWVDIWFPGARKGQKADKTYGLDNELPTLADVVGVTRSIVDWTKAHNKRVFRRLLHEPMQAALSAHRFPDGIDMLFADAMSNIG
jgi:hypothetical protein